METQHKGKASVAIIGAGITGLTAGWLLRRSGVDVTIFEATDRPGGVIRTLRQGDWLAEYGPNTLLETTPKMKQFFADALLQGRKLYSSPEAKARYIARGGKPVELPSTPPAFFASELFSWSAKLRLLVEPFIKRGTGEESVAQFVKRRLGQEFLDYAIDPLVSGIYAGDPHKISLRYAFAKVYNLEAKYGSLILGQILGAKERKKRNEISKADAPKVSFDDGLQVLTDTIAEQLKDVIRYNAPVCSLHKNKDGWTVKLASASQTHARSEFTNFAAVLIAIPAYQICNLNIVSEKNVDLSPLKEIEYPPVASVVLGFKRQDVSHPAYGFGVLVPRKEGFKILGTIFNSSLFPRRSPPGHITLTSYIGGAQNPELALMPSEKLVDATVNDLRTLLGVSGKPVFVHTCVYERAIPQYNIGYGRFLELMDEAERSAPGLFLAGHFRNGVSLSDSIHAGLSAGEKIAEFVKKIVNNGAKN